MSEILDKIIGGVLDLISNYPYISSIIFVVLGIYIIVYKIPKIKPFFKEKDAVYYRELFFYYGLTIFLFIYSIFLVFF